MSTVETIVYRSEVRPEDSAAVRAVVESTGFFNPAEIDIAQELVDERLARGLASGYYFLFAESAGQLCGYASYGPIEGTAASYDLFWIAVDRSWQSRGLGRRLIQRVEEELSCETPRRIYVETSSRDQYIPTRAFYERCGYKVEAVLADFYGPADDKVIFVKVVKR